MQISIRPYTPADETGWLRCRVLSFLDTAYFDNVLTQKDTYEYPAIELVAEQDGHIIGLLDVEYESVRGTVTYEAPKDLREALGAVIHNLAVHPDYQRHGIGGELFETASAELMRHGVGFVEAWTRDDEAACRWYESRGFREVHSYMHVYIDGREEAERALCSKLANLRVVSAFAHYIGSEEELGEKSFRRVHKCRLYRRAL